MISMKVKLIFATYVVLVVSGALFLILGHQFLPRRCDICEGSVPSPTRKVSDDPNHRHANANGHPASPTIPTRLRAPCWCSTLLVAHILVFADVQFCKNARDDGEECEQAVEKILRDVSELVFVQQFNIRLKPTIVTTETNETAGFMNWNCQNANDLAGSDPKTIDRQLDLLREACEHRKAEGYAFFLLFTGCPNMEHGIVPSNGGSLGVATGKFCHTQGVSASVIIDESLKRAAGKGGGNTFATALHEIGHLFGAPHSGVIGTSYGGTPCQQNNCGAVGGEWIDDAQYYGLCEESVYYVCHHLYERHFQCLRTEEGEPAPSECVSSAKPSIVSDLASKVGIALIAVAVALALLYVTFLKENREEVSAAPNAFTHNPTGRKGFARRQRKV